MPSVAIASSQLWEDVDDVRDLAKLLEIWYQGRLPVVEIREESYEHT